MKALYQFKSNRQKGVTCQFLELELRGKDGEPEQRYQNQSRSLVVSPSNAPVNTLTFPQGGPSQIGKGVSEGQKCCCFFRKKTIQEHF